MSVECYASSLEHILAEFQRIDLLICARIERARETQSTDAELQGLYIPEREVDDLLVMPPVLPTWAIGQAVDVQAALDKLAASDQAIQGGERTTWDPLAPRTGWQHFFS